MEQALAVGWRKQSRPAKNATFLAAF